MVVSASSLRAGWGGRTRTHVCTDVNTGINEVRAEERCEAGMRAAGKARGDVKPTMEVIRQEV